MEVIREGYFYTWVHGDECATGWSEVNLVAHKPESLCLLAQSLEDGEDLLGHHR